MCGPVWCPSNRTCGATPSGSGKSQKHKHGPCRDAAGVPGRGAQRAAVPVETRRSCTFDGGGRRPGGAARAGRLPGTRTGAGRVGSGRAACTGAPGAGRSPAGRPLPACPVSPSAPACPFPVERLHPAAPCETDAAGAGGPLLAGHEPTGAVIIAAPALLAHCVKRIGADHGDARRALAILARIVQRAWIAVIALKLRCIHAFAWHHRCRRHRGRAARDLG